MNESSDSPLYYQLVLLWLRDPAVFERYCELVAPVVSPYGGALDLQVHPKEIHAEGLERPDVVNLVHYTSRAAYDEFLRDQRFREIVHLRSSSVRMVSIEGRAIGAGDAPASGGAPLCVVEIARFGPAGAAGYRDYETKAEAVMDPYGYHGFRALRPESFTGLSFAPDIVKVAYFDSADALERLHADAAHAQLEGEWYPAAVDSSVWIVGTGRTTVPPHRAE